MPTVLRSAPYRFFFWSNDFGEPAHVHVESGDGYITIWLEPIGVANVRGYTPGHVSRILRIAKANQSELLERWRAFFNVE